MSDIIVSFEKDSEGEPVTPEPLPINQAVETRAKDSQHFLQMDANAKVKRQIASIYFPATSTYNVIRILPASPEQVIDTILSAAPIVEETLILGGLSGRRLTCPQISTDYSQTPFVVTPPDVRSAKDEPDPDAMLKDLRDRPFIKLKVTVKHS